MKNRYGNNSRLLYTDIDSIIYEIKTKDAYEHFSKGKQMFDFSNYSAKSKCHDDSNKLVVDKMKNKTAAVTIKDFFGLKPKMYSFLVDNSSEHKKAKGVNRNVVATIIHKEYKAVLLDNKCLRH